MIEHHKMVAVANAKAFTETVDDVSEAFRRLPVSTSCQSGDVNCTAGEEAGNKIRYGVAHFSKYYTEGDASKAVDSFNGGNLSATVLCQCTGSEVFRTMKSWTSQESLLEKYCSGSCQDSRLFQSHNMSSRDAAMYTVLSIRSRLATAAKDSACACNSCNATTAFNPQPLAARSKINSSKWASCHWPKKYVENQMNHTAEEETGDVVKFSLSHFSKHYIEMDAADESANSNTNGNQSDNSLKNWYLLTVKDGRFGIISMKSHFWSLK